MRIDPYEALAEYLALQLPVRGLVSRVLRNRGFRQLMDAAPGWRELITLGNASPDPFVLRDHLREWALEVLQVMEHVRNAPEEFVGEPSRATSPIPSRCAGWSRIARSSSTSPEGTSGRTTRSSA